MTDPSFTYSPALTWELKQIPANAIALLPLLGEDRLTVLERYWFYLRFSERLASTEEPFFRPSKHFGWGHHHQLAVLGNMTVLNHALELTELKRSFPQAVLHPYCELLLGMIEAFPGRGWPIRAILDDGRPCAEHWNALLKRYRKRVASKSIQRKLRRWLSMQTSHFESAAALVASLWAHGPSRMLFVRVDLGIREAHQCELHVFQMKAYFERLCANRRGKRSIFEHYVGLVWSLEYTAKKSYHYHCLYIFNGAYVQDGGYYADEIGRYWQTVITKGKGTYRNCNREAERYPELGIGLIDRRDEQKRGYLLENVIAYLTKEDHEVREAIKQDAQALGWSGRHIHTFDCSTPLRRRKEKRGRPRGLDDGVGRGMKERGAADTQTSP